MSVARPNVGGMNPAELQDHVSGTVLTAKDTGWDEARAFHSGRGEPDAIVRPVDASDVAAAVRIAAASATPVVVRGGGHSAWARLPGGLALDLRDLDDVEVDGTLVRIGGGATWGAVAEALAPHGLAISSGDTRSVGVGGLTLGGGIGLMVRAWGLAVDQLVGAQVVTATGEIVETTAQDHPDLFWALRGGGGNFGVVTRFDFRAHALPGAVHGILTVPEDPRPALRALRDLLADAPRELTASYMDVPAMDPSAPAGASIVVVWAGDDTAAAERALAPLRAVSGVEGELRRVRYADILEEMPGADETGQEMPGFVGGNMLARVVDDDLIDRLVAFRAAYPASVVFLRSLGGAFADVAQEDTPFPARDATMFVMAGAFDMPQFLDDGERERVRADWAEIAARGSGMYGNFIADPIPGLAEQLFAPAAWERLRGIKRTWDPENLFSRNHNIVPEGGA